MALDTNVWSTEPRPVVQGLFSVSVDIYREIRHCRCLEPSQFFVKPLGS